MVGAIYWYKEDIFSTSFLLQNIFNFLWNITRWGNILKEKWVE